MKITLSNQLKAKPDFSNLGFGKFFTDHMLTCRYEDGKWGEMEIVPYKSFELDPATTCLHYGQGIFEGLKAYKKADKITLFRPRDNFVRMNKSARRLCMPELDIDRVMEGLTELIKIEKDWIPVEAGTSLYIRPTMFAVDPYLGVRAGASYLFYIILSPVGSYYAGGLKPTKILVEDTFVRAAIGGTGEAKCMGNYSASLLAGKLAAERGFDQVLWLDAATRKNVEEVGSMNMFFVIDGVVKTPALSGSILSGITRNSVLRILEDEGVPFSETTISMDEIAAAAKDGSLTEAFGSGTAAVISPVGSLNYKGVDIVIGGGEMGKITSRLYDRLTGIQYGKYPDKFNWVMEVK